MGRYNSAQGGMDVLEIACGGSRIYRHSHGSHLLHMMKLTRQHMPLVASTSRLGRCLRDACVWMAEDIVR